MRSDLRGFLLSCWPSPFETCVGLVNNELSIVAERSNVLDRALGGSAQPSGSFWA